MEKDLPCPHRRNQPAKDATGGQDDHDIGRVDHRLFKDFWDIPPTQFSVDEKTYEESIGDGDDPCFCGGATPRMIPKMMIKGMMRAKEDLSRVKITCQNVTRGLAGKPRFLLMK